MEAVLIVPLWNWNCLISVRSLILSCFNCTFMELKFITTLKIQQRVTVLIVPLWNWNRVLTIPMASRICFNCTFMELKSHLSSAQQSRVRVLIVPLWNWNGKLVRHQVWLCRYVLIVPLWNWNFLPWRCYEVASGFNCTFMELKLSTHENDWLGLHVLIVPLWNWNCWKKLPL